MSKCLNTTAAWKHVFFFFTVLAVYIERTRVADGPIGKADKKLSVTGGAIMSSQGQDEDNIIIMF